MKVESKEIINNDASSIFSSSKTLERENVKIEPKRSIRVKKETNLGDGFCTFPIQDDHLTYIEAINSSDAFF